MRSLLPSAAAVVAAGGLVVGCVIFTGGSSGYTQVDGGEDANLPFGCFSSADCTDAGSDPACCFGIVGTSLGSTCSASACTFGEQQLCGTSAECADGVECVEQTCGGSLPFNACGVISISLPTGGPVTSCVPTGATSDAGNGGSSDAASADAASADAASDAHADGASEAGNDASADAAANDAGADAGP